jgi:hypothetical protein
MSIIIKANTNKQSGLYFPLCFATITKTIAFTDSCKYNSGSEQSDLHKLFGIGIFHLFGSFKAAKNKKWWELHKWISIRAGWRYNPTNDTFEITDYTYVNGVGERDTTDNIIVSVKANEIFTITTYIEKDILGLVIKTSNREVVIQKNCKTPVFLCVPFFLRLRAYVGSGYTTKNDIVIKTYSSLK